METKREKTLRRMKRAALHIYGAVVCGGFMAVWALPAAWSERGYRGGIGGEWLLIVCAAWVGMSIADKLTKQGAKQ